MLAREGSGLLIQRYQLTPIPGRGDNWCHVRQDASVDWECARHKQTNHAGREPWMVAADKTNEHGGSYANPPAASLYGERNMIAIKCFLISIL